MLRKKALLKVHSLLNHMEEVAYAERVNDVSYHILDVNAQEALKEDKDGFFDMVKKYNERGELKRLYKELVQRELVCSPDWYVDWEED